MPLLLLRCTVMRPAQVLLERLRPVLHHVERLGRCRQSDGARLHAARAMVEVREHARAMLEVSEHARAMVEESHD
jgi:hypothetical protein